MHHVDPFSRAKTVEGKLRGFTGHVQDLSWGFVMDSQRLFTREEKKGEEEKVRKRIGES